jgi:hypothetical protein
MDLAERLSLLAGEEYGAAVQFFDGMSAEICSLYVMEACRVMDYEHVLNFISRNPNHRLPAPEFDTLVRGWNPFMALALPRMAEMGGIPIRESTAEFRGHIRALLYSLGSYSVVKKAVEMLRAGMVTASEGEGHISIHLHDRTAIDHFLDPLEYNKLEDALGPAEKQPEFTKDRIDTIRRLMEPLTFPWDTGHGLMVGYEATEEIDSFFIEAISESAEFWRSQAGIHPDVVIGPTRGSVLAAIVLLLGSFYLKHIHFVDVGARLNPATNYAMALTIWKPPEEMALSLAEFTQFPATRVRGAIEALAVTKEHADFFAAEQKPYIPMLLRFSDDHYVSPISSIFHNPLEGVRLLGGHYSPAFEQELLRHREAWMIDELRHIFLGTRYAQTTGPTRLRRSGTTLTDIDWAILDVTTGELALFQLKWQDFMTSGVKKQRSRAQNFGTQVEAWRSRVESWIAEFGIEQLLRALHLPAQRRTPV